MNTCAAMLTKTTTALLEGLVDPANDAVWREFDGRFRPILVGLARRLGLSSADAADIAQETLVRFVAAYRAGKYDRDRGRLRSWIIGIARRCIAEWHHERMARHERHGLSQVADVEDESRLTHLFDQESQREILQQALTELRAETRMDARTIRAFEALAYDQRPPAQVAAELGMSLNDVYLAKHRCLKRLREIVARINEAFEIG